jgi:hypothetical protein
LKRHSDIGPNGLGAIYLIDATTGAATTASLFYDFGAAAGSTGRAGPPSANVGQDAIVIPVIGKVGFGDLDVFVDPNNSINDAVYVVNLADRQLYRIPILPGAPPTATPGSAVGFAMPGTAAPLPGATQGCASADVRPFGATFGGQPALEFSLDSARYPRGCANGAPYNPLAAPPCNGGGAPIVGGRATWRPWNNPTSPVGPANYGFVDTQPLLSDIVFDNGDLIIGFRDRYGDQYRDARPAGDIVRACANGAGWALENNATCGSSTTGGANNVQGPGGGEYYYQDDYSQFHDELISGGLVQVPGVPTVAVALYDPVYSGPNTTFDGGIRWLDNASGMNTRAYRLFDGVGNASPTDFGKSNGLGDLEALCDAAPIEIGNRVWFDPDQNGVQDPGETPIGNVTVHLYSPRNTLIATATTDLSGTYYFSAAAGSSTASAVYNIAGLTQNTAGFTVRLDNPADYQTGGPLYQYTVTQANVGGNTQDMRDSDGVLPNPAAPASGANPPTTTVDTGGAGANNHTYDFGFHLVPTAITLTSFTATRAGEVVDLRWTTSAEVNTWGFHLYRSADGTRANAARITPELVLGKGRGQGATYDWIDAGAAPGVAYSYWLQEVELGGATSEYGPVTVAGTPATSRDKVFLPFIDR